jgi:hypothetical protein
LSSYNCMAANVTRFPPPAVNFRKLDDTLTAKTHVHRGGSCPRGNARPPPSALYATARQPVRLYPDSSRNTRRNRPCPRSSSEAQSFTRGRHAQGKKLDSRGFVSIRRGQYIPTVSSPPWPGSATMSTGIRSDAAR